MLDSEPVDVDIICTPSGLHGEIACQVMRSGRHVIVEKPMEITREAIDEMLRVQQATGVKLAVISQHRFDQASLQVKDLTSWVSKSLAHAQDDTLWTLRLAKKKS